MELITWDESLSIGIEEIDEQHKKLIAIVNRLFTAMKERHPDKELGTIIDDLIDFTEYHFGTEEKHFADFKYEQTEAHIAEHNRFRDRIKQFQQDFEAEKISLSTKMLMFLHDWITNHLRGVDRLYVDCFKEHGVK